MVALGVGIVTLATIICCTKKRHNNQLEGEQIMYSSGIAWQGLVPGVLDKQ